MQAPACYQRLRCMSVAARFFDAQPCWGSTRPAAAGQSLRTHRGSLQVSHSANRLVQPQLVGRRLRGTTALGRCAAMAYRPVRARTHSAEVGVALCHPTDFFGAGGRHDDPRIQMCCVPTPWCAPSRSNVFSGANRLGFGACGAGNLNLSKQHHTNRDRQRYSDRKS
jgi:hypothetical protein